MKKPKKRFSKCITLSLVFALLMVAVSGVVSANNATLLGSTPESESIHEKIDISEITGEIAEPPMLTSAASSIAEEKEWYEYVYYSSTPVGYYYINGSTRLAFYDPYVYSDALIMEVDDSLTDWSSNNSLQISYTTGNSMTNTSGKSTDSSSSVQVVEGNDTTETTAHESTVKTTVEGNIYTYNYGMSGDTTQSQDRLSKEQLWDPASYNQGTIVIGSTQTAGTTGVEISLEESATFSWQGDTKTHQDTVADYEGESWNTHSKGYTQDDSTTTSKTSGGGSTVTSTIANRITSAVGSSTSTSVALSTNNSVTITKTYDASHFNAGGSPLQWKIIKYTVKMPMKYQTEYLVDNEWVFGDYNYCLLTTIQGTTRAWMQNSVVYYEHWGTGEAVTWDEFWSQFFTEERLIAAYRNRLYPDN